MKFSFTNLGLINKADIEVNGLTVITGLNDTGKSFISKAIYSLVKTTNNFERLYDLRKVESLINQINHVFALHRQSSLMTNEKLNRFNPEIIRVKIIESVLDKKTSHEELHALISNYFDNMIGDIETPSPLRPNAIKNKDGNLAAIRRIKERVLSELIDNPQLEGKLKIYFDEEIIQDQFQGQINKISSDDALEIFVTEGETELATVRVEENKTTTFQINSPILLKEATVIETPTIIQLERFITNSLAFSISRQRNDLPPYYLDVLTKIRLGQNKLNSDLRVVYDQIKKIIGGEFSFRSEEGGIVFSKESGVSIKPFNIASGVKSFGLLQLLLSCGAINQESILIIDEPEVHLHPAWIEDYSIIIAQIVAVGVPVIVSSHSPYLIEALGKLGSSSLLNGKVKFYFGAKVSNDASAFADVSNDLNPIFEALAKPMRKIAGL